MSKVIKNNDGVAIVEGTPASSLVKDANKFFAAKVDTRMAGETVKPKTMRSIVQSGRIDTRQGKGSEEIRAASALTKPMMQMIDGRNTIVGYMLDGETTMFDEAQMNLSSLEKADLLPQRVKTAMQGGDPRGRVRGRSLDPKEINIRRPTPKDLEQMNNPPSVEPVPVSEPLRETSKFSEPEMKANEEEKTPQEKEMKREEALDKTREFKRLRFAERSADEQEATKGKFITTLGS